MEYLRPSFSNPGCLNRRSFLSGAAAVTLASLLAGCSSPDQAVLKVRLLSGSIPPQVVGRFRRVLEQARNSAHLDFASELQLQTLFTQLQTWKQQQDSSQDSGFRLPSWFPGANRLEAGGADLVTLGHAWLETAIRQGLIQPLEAGSLPATRALFQDSRWQALVTRNDQGLPDPRGKLWAAPYRWGTTVIAYRQDIFRKRGLQPPTDWPDLWRSDLRRQISLLDQPREVIGLTLKKLGKSYNTADLTTVSGLESELQALQQQVKLYSSTAYLQPLILEDTWVAVGWSTDLLPLMQNNPNIAAVVPRSGTALWADLWVRPTSSKTTASLVTDWINFCWQPDIASQLSVVSRATSPIVLTLDRGQLPTELRQNPILLPDPAVLAASEFLLPLPESSLRQYQELWRKVRLSEV